MNLLEWLCINHTDGYKEGIARWVIPTSGEIDIISNTSLSRLNTPIELDYIVIDEAINRMKECIYMNG